MASVVGFFYRPERFDKKGKKEKKHNRKGEVDVALMLGF